VPELFFYYLGNLVVCVGRFHVAMSREFIARGHTLAAATGGVWPFELEAATRAHLRRHLRVDLPE
jgi:hypothetical protein